ncbi:probable 3-hydroxyisobutyryl-CoA hydrolase 3 isoform X2 [Solanum dulcamara]|uniref:probable 3-hydroxyisobutyryl-CoA hydrolase 3 isoform X2 n=1 Tax=Solanum dulcamara TaxID=45834 RepID=UPI0024858CE5|nr:probable 3-hydroxyisobutyryl-CoA hydrolase 3 isoform X2 [Solanum dulcamara]
MASRIKSDPDLNQVLFEATPCVQKVTLNRPTQLNCLTFEMIDQLLRTFEEYEQDPQVRAVIVKGKGKAFCAGGDVVRVIQFMLQGDLFCVMEFYRKQLTLDYLVATYKKTVVFLINGAVMGGGAGLSMNAKFRIVTENTVFAMPEASFGHHPDVGASYFLSRLPGHFGEYLGLTGAKINGSEMLACGLATHFVYSKDMKSMEDALCEELLLNTSSKSDDVSRIIKEFVHNPVLKEGSSLKRLDAINRCFGKDTVEEILFALEKEATTMDDKWITNAIKSIKFASPTSLKISLRSIREGRKQTLRQCLNREFNISSHIVLRSFNYNGFYEWEPSKLEQVHDAIVMQFSEVVHDDRWGYLELPERAHLKGSKL